MQILKWVQRLKDNKVIKEVTSFISAIGQHYVAPNSASIAFYLFISLIPLFILLCSQLPLTGISRAEMTAVVTNMLPETVKGLIKSIITQAYQSRIGVFSLSIVILLWSSSRGVLALIRSLDIIYDEQDSRNTINMYMFSIFYTVCILFAVSIMLVLYTKELTAEDLLRHIMPSEPIYGKLAQHMKKFDVVFFGTMIAALIYKIAPAGKRKFTHQLPGAVFAALAISVFSVYFAAYSSGSNIYNSFYGSLTTVSLFLIWIYSCINIVLIGGVINSHFREPIGAFFDMIGAKLTNKRMEKREQRQIRKLAKADAKQNVHANDLGTEENEPAVIK